MSDLKPCPFCGGEPTIKHRASSMSDGSGFFAFVTCYCGGYSATAHRMGIGETVSAAIDAASKLWNTRTGSKGDE